ncbi:MAG: phosphodiesterase [Solirubrobacterales bacterium]|nr:phosphodiesterase [Solirubrobacterales bacterium]
MRRNLRRPGALPLVAGLAAIVALLVTSVAVASAHPGHAAPPPHAGHDHKAEHVLLLSVDGLHQSDLQWYVGKHPHSALASLVGNGVEFTHAQTPVPSDSVPGMVGQVTGGNPGTTGMYYDETYNRELLPAGTTDCANAKPGAEVLYTEQADKNLHSIDAGQGSPACQATSCRRPATRPN